MICIFERWIKVSWEVKIPESIRRSWHHSVVLFTSYSDYPYKLCTVYTWVSLFVCWIICLFDAWMYNPHTRFIHVLVLSVLCKVNVYWLFFTNRCKHVHAGCPCVHCNVRMGLRTYDSGTAICGQSFSFFSQTQQSFVKDWREMGKKSCWSILDYFVPLQTFLLKWAHPTENYMNMKQAYETIYRKVALIPLDVHVSRGQSTEIVATG